jgi:hypothetical protein
MSDSVAPLYDPIRVPFRTCAREGKHISHKIWIRMYPIGKARMHCVVCKSCCCAFSILYSRDISCCGERTVSCFLFLYFFYLQGKSVASISEMESVVYPETLLPTYKGTLFHNPKCVCSWRKILTAGVLSRQFLLAYLSEEYVLSTPFHLALCMWLHWSKRQTVGVRLLLQSGCFPSSNFLISRFL